MEELKIIENYEEKIAAYDLMLNTLMFDTETIACKDGKEHRLEAIEILMEDYYNLKNDDKVYDALKKLEKCDLAYDQKRKVKLLLKEFNKLKSIPKDLYLKIQSVANKSQMVWEKAKENNDYSLFAPYLKELIKLDIEACKYRNKDLDCYDLLLDDHEEGMNQEKYDIFFDMIKTELLPLIKKINAKNSELNFKNLKGNYDINKQKEFIKILADYLHFDNSWGYIGEYMHPFTCAISPNDVRITTYYRQDDVVDGIFSTIHEIGHGFYEHQTSEELMDSILSSKSNAMHESQSRLLENNIARRKAFWINLFPKLKEIFAKELEDIDLDDFWHSINKSECSLIRTMADELTYPIHILIRYELEKEIFAGKCNLDNLNILWNEKVEKYLGIKVDKDSNGILQDVHWASNEFGYFPTYALGSAFAAQIFYHLNKEIDVDSCLINNNFIKIENWLKEHIHCYGGLYDANTILKKALNEEFNPKYYIDYLKEKYQKLYDIIK